MTWNTYKGSARDGIKYLSKNGVTIPFSPNWGWTGHKTLDTASIILEIEFGPKTAVRVARSLANWLARQSDSNFTLTSGFLWYLVKQM